MTVITIREQSLSETEFNATLVIAGKNYQIAVINPFSDKQQYELEWYFEEWLRYPILDNVKATRAKISIQEYGEALFKQVFQSNIKAYAKYHQLLNDSNQSSFRN